MANSFRTWMSHSGATWTRGHGASPFRVSNRSVMRKHIIGVAIPQTAVMRMDNPNCRGANFFFTSICPRVKLLCL